VRRDHKVYRDRKVNKVYRDHRVLTALQVQMVHLVLTARLVLPDRRAPLVPKVFKVSMALLVLQVLRVL
jgi:hypothetical protein